MDLDADIMIIPMGICQGPVRKVLFTFLFLPSSFLIDHLLSTIFLLHSCVPNAFLMPITS